MTHDEFGLETSMNERSAGEDATVGPALGLDIRRALAPTSEEIRSERLGSNKEVASELLSAKGTRALDVGCGDGRFTRLLATMFETVDGIDVNARRIEQARQPADAGGLAITFRAGSGEALPYPDESFDVVVFSNSLHHIPDMDRALSEAERVLVPNGLLYVMEPVPAGNYFEATKLVNDETGVKNRGLPRHRAGGAPRLRLAHPGDVPLAPGVRRFRGMARRTDGARREPPANSADARRGSAHAVRAACAVE